LSDTLHLQIQLRNSQWNTKCVWRWLSGDHQVCFFSFWPRCVSQVDGDNYGMFFKGSPHKIYACVGINDPILLVLKCLETSTQILIRSKIVRKIPFFFSSHFQSKGDLLTLVQISLERRDRYPHRYQFRQNSDGKSQTNFPGSRKSEICN
jgi:hypothetical protein